MARRKNLNHYIILLHFVLNLSLVQDGLVLETIGLFLANISLFVIERSMKIGNGFLGIDISKIKDSHGNTSNRCACIPRGYPFYLWNKEDGDCNIGAWIEDAVKEPE